MLDQPYFHFSLLRKYTVLFGSLFKDIYVERTLPDGTETQMIQVPLEYGPKDKHLARLNADPKIQRPYAELLPRMSFEMGEPTYVGADAIPKLNYVKRQSGTSPSDYLHQFSSVRYDFPFSLSIAVKNTEDADKIVEQILPFFRPDYTVEAELIPDMGIVRNIPTVFTGISKEDKYDGQFQNRTLRIWTLKFVMHGFLFGPITKPNIIKFVTTTFYLRPSDSNDPSSPFTPEEIANSTPGEAVTVQVALTANGQPTSNVQQSVPVRLINLSDDFGYASYVTNLDSDLAFPQIEPPVEP